jgi:hypothetical protein
VSFTCNLGLSLLLYPREPKASVDKEDNSEGDDGYSEDEDEDYESENDEISFDPNQFMHILQNTFGKILVWFIMNDQH